ncbi:MAG: DNA-binding protein [Alphaproteobacteria bacterium]
MAKPIAKVASDLPKLAAPAKRALSSAGLTSLEKLARASEADVMALHGMGPNAMKAISTAMKARGLAFAKR